MYEKIKRIFDVLLSLIAIIILLPIFIITAIGVFISSPGPVLYKAKRCGKKGKTFIMYKFRTMYINGEKGHLITLRNDNRIFPFGRFLRKSKIDELPQLFNILNGTMSIVGWRPEDEENIGKVFVGKYKKILGTKPGLTSPGSLFDYTHGEMFDSEELYEAKFLPKKMELELYYVNHRSLLYDGILIIRTIFTICLVVVGKKEFNLPREMRRINHEI